MTHRLLVIEQNSIADQASLCGWLTAGAGFSCESANWDALRLDSLRRCTAHLIIAAPKQQTPPVISMFEWLRASRISTPIFAVLPSNTTEPLLRLAAETTDDFILSPIRPDELRHRIARMLGTVRHDLESVRQRLMEEMGLTQLVGSDAMFLAAVERVSQFARYDAPVLITGETGTGKELCARAIHYLGKRRDRPFVAVDCAAIPDHLLENELFGHARGAFTDAQRDQRGLATMADGGTLFLDEIDAVSLTAQPKLLRFLETRTFKPLGSDRFTQVDVNVIAATNRDLETAMAERQFRSDLFFRLNVLRLHLPPLRQRCDDIAMLARHFLDTVAKPRDGARKSFTPSALRKLALHDWPGNIRELLNVVQRAVVLCEGTQILPHHIAVPDPRPAEASPPTNFRQARAGAIAHFERAYVEQLLRNHDGNITRAARAAAKDRRAFGRLVKKYQIPPRGL